MSSQLETRLEKTSSPVASSPANPVERRALVVIRYPVGGIRTHIRYTYPTLDQAGYRFTFVVPAADSMAAFEETVRDLRGAEVIGVPTAKGRCSMVATIRRLLRGGRFDLMHSHGFTAAVQAVLANAWTRLPHLTTIHDVVRDEQFPGLHGRVKRWILGLGLRQIHRIVAVSEDVRNNLLTKLGPLRRCAEKITIVPNGIALPEEAPSPAGEDLRQRLQLSPETRLLGFLGRFMEQKGFVELLAALRQLCDRPDAPPFHLAAIGSGDREREYRKEIARLGLERHITILPFVMEVRPALRQLDLLVVPSLWEASSLLSMEAMTAGVPVLGTDCIGLREVLRDTPSRMVRSGNPTDLCAGIVDALENPWNDASEAFVPEARRRFDCRPRACDFLKLFSQMVQQGR